METILIRSTSWVIHKIGLPTLFFWSLLLVIIGCLVHTLNTSVNGLEGLLPLLAFWGLLAGWLLGRWRAAAWQAGLLIIIAGAGVVFWRVGRLGIAAGGVLNAGGSLAREYLRWPGTRPFPNPQALLLSLDRFTTNILALSQHLVQGLAGLFSPHPVYNPVGAALVWGQAVWFSAGWAAWAVRRGHPLAGAVLAVALQAGVMAYTRQKPGLLVFVLLAVLLLMAWSDHQALESSWQKRALDYPEDLYLDRLLITSPLVGLLVLLAAVAPNLGPARLQGLARQFFGPAPNKPAAVGRSLGLEPRTQPKAASLLAQNIVGGLPQNHLLGAGEELSKQVVMTISTGELPPGPPEVIRRSSPPRRYWRSLAYDIYSGHGWLTSPTVEISYSAGQSVAKTSPGSGQDLNQEVEWAGSSPTPAGLVYAAGELQSVDQPYRAAWRQPPEVYDLFGASTTTQRFLVKSRIADPTVEQLQAASQQYPPEIASRYLTLPKDLPGRVLALGRDLTATQSNPYDRAAAIQDYLRTFSYTLDISSPPRDQDVVDYFLFDLKKGYCDYYASAMVVLARAAGLPARLATGYAPGSYDYFRAHYVITAADAHSWPEIYFPGYGWVVFEPTASREIPARGGPAAAVALLPTPQVRPLAGFTFDPAGARRLGLWAGLAVLLGVAWLASDRLRLRLLPASQAVALLYRRTYRAGQAVIPRRPAGDTPFEFAAALTAALNSRCTALRDDHPIRTWLEAAQPEIQQITALYAQSAYSPHPPAPGLAHQAVGAWGRLRWRLLAARLFGRT